MLAPAAALFAVPLVDAAVALLRGRDAPRDLDEDHGRGARRSDPRRCATTLTVALWPGIAALALIAGLGYLFGFRHWHPQRLVAMRPASLPLLLLFDEPPGTPAVAARGSPGRARPSGKPPDRRSRAATPGQRAAGRTAMRSPQNLLRAAGRPPQRPHRHRLRWILLALLIVVVPAIFAWSRPGRFGLVSPTARRCSPSCSAATSPRRP